MHVPVRAGTIWERLMSSQKDMAETQRPDAAAKPGKPRVFTDADTLPNKSLKKHVAAIHTDGQLSLLQRKLSNVLLINAYDALLTQPEHDIDEKTLCVMLGYDSNDRKPLKAALKALTAVQAEWNILDDNQDEVEWGVASLLSHAVLSKGRCRYGYAPTLAEKLYNPAIYASINMKIQRKFKSGHALALYENCYRFKKVGTTGWWDLLTFRRLMGVAESDYYSQFKHLNAKIIKPVTKEINAHSDIEIEPEFKRKGRRITDIRFLIRSNAQLPLLDINDEAGVKDTTVYKRLIAQGISHKLAQSWITQYGHDYVQEKLDLVAAQNQSGRKIVSVSGFLNAAIADDYAPPGPNVKAKAAGLEKRRKAISERAKANAAAAARSEQEKAARLAKTRRARDWVEALTASEQKAILTRFEATLDKPYLKADFKRAGLKAPLVAERFANFVDL